MSPQNKILIGLAAVVAFAIGFSINMASVSDKVDTATLLNAKLIVNKTSGLQVEDQLLPAPAEDIELNTVEDSYTTAEDSFATVKDSYATVEDSLGELTLVNFWASWCAPCREEMPVFENLYRQASTDGFTIIGIALDTPEKAQPMLDSMDISYPILYAETTGSSIMESVGNPQGLLPYSLLLDKNGNLLEQVLGQIHEQQIVDWLAKYL